MQITTKAQDEKAAFTSMADLVKNPPKNPVEMVQWVSKNFSVSAEITGAISKALPSVGKLVPIAGAIFEVFSSFSAPSIGEQIASAVEAITGQIVQAVEELKNALDFSAEKTITAITDEIQNVTQEESAARVMQALAETELFQALEVEKAAIFTEYQSALLEENKQWRETMLAEIAEAQAEVTAAYKKIQEFLAIFGIDLTAEILRLYEKLQETEQTARGPVLEMVPSSATPPVAKTPESQITPVIVLTVAGALFFLYRKKS